MSVTNPKLRSALVPLFLAAQILAVQAAARGEHPPPLHESRQLKILYATQARSDVPTIVLFVNDPELLHFSYMRYLENRIRSVFGFAGVRLRILARQRSSRDGA